MLKRLLVILFLVPTLVLATQPGTRVHGVVMTPEELASLEAADAPDNASAEKPEGNGFVRALKAPFKALGRLFGGGKKKDQNQSKVQRMSNDDAKRFESVAARTVSNGRVITKEAGSDAKTTGAPTTSEYSVHLNKGRDLLNAGELTDAIAEL